MTWGDILLIIALTLVLFIAVVAVIRGFKGMKKSKSFESGGKKARIGYWVASFLHMLAGALITLCYIIAGVLIAMTYMGGR